VSVPETGLDGRLPLRVGQVPGVTVTKWRRIWAERFPRSPLEVVDTTVAAQRAALADGTVDLCFVRLPIDSAGLHAIPLYDEVPVVVAPREHPAAAFDELSLADLAGEPRLVDDETPEAFERVAWGQGLLLVPLSVARTQSRRDLVHRPVVDAAPTTVALAWLADNPDERIEEFIGIVRGRSANSSRTARERSDRTATAGTSVPAKQSGTAANGRRPRSGGRGRKPGRSR
jgi:DNA-binding transcriptional LysR family regulator